jgi:homocysteine S-methyltransferase
MRSSPRPGELRDDPPMTRALLDRLAAGDTLVLDGAIGTELQRRGVPVDSTAWCALASRSHPDLLRQIHVDYITAGADVITANTFASARHVLEAAGLGSETDSLNRESVALARQAVEQSADRTVLVAGSMSSMGPLDGSWAPHDDAAATAYREQAEILADAGADVLVAEMMLDVANASLVIAAAEATGLPLLVGWSASSDGAGGVATYREDSAGDYVARSFDRLMEEAVSLGGDVLGIMHTEVGVVHPALEIAAAHWSGPLLAYAEIGHFVSPDWVFTDEVPPARYAEVAMGWVDAGVQVVGGCCGTTPEHVGALEAALTGRAGERIALGMGRERPPRGGGL